MAKRKPEEPKPGAPAWQSTFADLMNLLLCFFVLLFAMSTIDAQKFELVAASFSQTFSIFNSGGSSLKKGLLIDNGVSQLSQLDQYMSTMGKASESEVEGEQDAEFEDKLSEVQEEMLNQNEELSEKISEAISEQGLDGDVDIDFTSQYVELTLNGSLLFDSGSDMLKPEANELLSKIGVILEKYADSTIEVEGHTDNVPIHTARFANNNELLDSLHISDNADVDDLAIAYKAGFYSKL